MAVASIVVTIAVAGVSLVFLFGARCSTTSSTT
jgi:hypothetical protein